MADFQRLYRGLLSTSRYDLGSESGGFAANKLGGFGGFATDAV